MRVPGWHVIRSLGEIRYFSISYAALIVIPILFELHSRAAAESEAFRDAIAFPASLKWLYTASICYAISVTSYQLACPEIVKKHANEVAYIAGFADVYSEASEHLRPHVVRTHLDSDLDREVLEQIDALQERADSGDAAALDELNTLIAQNWRSTVVRALAARYERARSSLPFARVVAVIGYGSGSLILAWLLLVRLLRIWGWI